MEGQASREASSGRSTILGNGQYDRVIPFAEKTGGKTLESGLSAKEWNALLPKQQFKLNDGLLRERIKAGDIFRDIGPDGIVRALDLRRAELTRLSDRAIPLEIVGKEEILRILGGSGK